MDWLLCISLTVIGAVINGAILYNCYKNGDDKVE